MLHIDNGVGIAHGDCGNQPLLAVYRQGLLNKTLTAAIDRNVLGGENRRAHIHRQLQVSWQ